ncbi:MAG: WD40 repeat domain-containing protein [Bacteroidota bacterium]
MKNIYKYILFSACIFFWNLLTAQDAFISLQTGHSDAIQTLAFSPDGKYLASAGNDNIIILWDFDRGKEVWRFKGHSKRVNTLLFHDDRLISGAADGKVHFWNMKDGSLKGTLSLPGNDSVTALSFSPDGNKLAVCGNFRKILVVNPENFSIIQSIEYREKVTSLIPISKNAEYKMKNYPVISSVVFINNDSLAVGGSAGITVYSLSSGQKAFRCRAPYINSLSLQDGSTENIFFTTLKGSMGMYSPAKNKKLFQRASNFKKYPFTSLAQGEQIACGCEDNNIYLWSKDQCAFRKTLSGHKEKVTSVVFHPLNKNILVSAGADKSILVWDIKDGKIIRQLGSLVYPITAMSVKPDGSALLVASGDNSVRMAELKGPVRLHPVSEEKANIPDIGALRGDTVFVASANNILNFYLLSNGKLLKKTHGNHRVSYFNAVLHLPALSLFLNTFTGFFYVKYFMLSNYERIDHAINDPANKLTAFTGGGFDNGIFYRWIFPRVSRVFLINNQTLNKEGSFQGHHSAVSDMAFNRNGSMLATCGTDFLKGSKIQRKKNKKETKFDKSIKFHNINAVKIWDIEKHKLKYAFESTTAVKALCFSQVNDTLLLINEGDSLIALNPSSSKAHLIATSSLAPLMCSQDGHSVYAQSISNTIQKRDVSTSALLAEMKGHNDKISSLISLDNGKRIATASWDGSIRIWDAETGNEIVSLVLINKNDFVMRTPDNYYYATKNAIKELGFSYEMKFYPFEQFDLKYNRPDIVLGRLGHASPELISAYLNAYQKRLKKMNFTAEMLSSDLHLPDLRIENRKEIPLETTNQSLNIQITATDSLYKINRINVWINNVPAFGMNGLSVQNKNENFIMSDLMLTLSEGQNTIMLSCMNNKGVESLKETFQVTRTAAPVKHNLYVVAVSVSDYQDARYKLNYAAKDGRDIANLLASNRENYNAVYIDTLFNEAVTASAFSQIKTRLLQSSVDDEVVMFISGHGLLGKNYDFYFAPWDCDFEDPDRNGISYDVIEGLLDSIPARKKITYDGRLPQRRSGQR